MSTSFIAPFLFSTNTAAAVPAPSPMQQTIGMTLYADWASWDEEMHLPATGHIRYLRNQRPVRNGVVLALGQPLNNGTGAAGLWMSTSGAFATESSTVYSTGLPPANILADDLLLSLTPISAAVMMRVAFSKPGTYSLRKLSSSSPCSLAAASA